MIPLKLKEYIADNFKDRKVACFTGAGISTESGIPAFRGKGGLWEKYDPAIYANADGLLSLFKSNPQKVIDFLSDFYGVMLDAKPSPAHLVLKEMEEKGVLKSIITQNIDGLHQEAGSQNVIELHGNAFRLKCMKCPKKEILQKPKIREMLNMLNKQGLSRMGILKVLSRYFKRCICKSRYRIDIVLFQEMLPEEEFKLAFRQLEECRTLLLIGTSLVIYPAANIPFYAKKKKIKIIEINKEKSAFSNFCDFRIELQASRALSEIAKILKDNP